MTQSLVLLHGWGLNSAVWESIKPQLSQAVDLHAIDLPGFGDAGWKPAYSDINSVADYLASYIQHHAVSGRAAVLGWSMGGLLATTLALRHPARVTQLFTVASSPCFISKPEQNWAGMDLSVLTAFQAQLSDDFKSTLKRFLAVQAMGSPSARSDMKELQALLLRKPLPLPAALEAGLSWLKNVDLRSQLDQLDSPLHRAYGRLDTLVPASIASEISCGDSKIFAQSAHAPFLNQRDEFLHWLLDAL